MRVVWTCSMILVVCGCAAASEARAAGDEAAVVLTPKPSPQPKINGAKIFGVRPGHPLLFTIAATGRRPMRFAAEGLPEGLTLDRQTGRISGRIDPSRRVRGHASAPRTPGRRPSGSSRIVVGDRLALTPHMGWNSWYIWSDGVTDKIMRDAADAMVASGMIDHGYMYVNIDECWEVKPGAKDPINGGPAARRPRQRQLEPSLSRHEGAGRLHPSPRPQGGASTRRPARPTAAASAAVISTKPRMPGGSPRGASISSSTTGVPTAASPAETTSPT